MYLEDQLVKERLRCRHVSAGKVTMLDRCRDGLRLQKIKVFVLANEADAFIYKHCGS
jgi:hypothetical protein